MVVIILFVTKRETSIFFLPPFTGVLTNLMNALKQRIRPAVTQKNRITNVSDISWLDSWLDSLDDDDASLASADNLAKWLATSNVSLFFIRSARMSIRVVKAVPNATWTRCKGK